MTAVSLRMGAHLIVRNERHRLARCLESVRSFVDEIVVVDFGSTDGTPDVARAFGARIVTAEWPDHFAQARNIALENGSTDWVLWIDADETVAAGADALRETLERTDAEALTVSVVNRTGVRPFETVVCPCVRLLRRRPEYRFAGRIHEHPVNVSDGEPVQPVGESPLVFEHDGYMPADMESKAKADRNLRLLEIALSERPDDPFYLYQTGVTFAQKGRTEDAVRRFTKAWRLTPRSAAFRPGLARDLAIALLQCGRWEEARDHLRHAVRDYPDYPDLHHFLGGALFRCGQWNEAARCWKHCLDLADHPSRRRYVTETAIGSIRTFEALAELAGRCGNFAEMAAWLERSLSVDPTDETRWEKWLDAGLRSGWSDDEAAERLVSRLPEKVRDEQPLIAARLLARVGAYANALRELERVLREVSHLPDTAVLLQAQCLMQTGRFAEAEACLLQASGYSTRPDFWEMYAVCRWQNGKTFSAREYEKIPECCRAAIEQIDRLLKTGVAGAEPGSDDRSWDEWVDKAVRHNALSLAERLIRLHPASARTYPQCLYRHGYVLPAADRLLRRMEADRLTADEYAMLAEILYDRGHAVQAAVLFERSVELAPHNDKARIGAALSWLQLARQTLMEGLARDPGHPGLLKDLENVEWSIRLLESTGWHTSWNAAQRRKSDVRTHFPVHDRPQ
ncbi:MAG: hypothetical protein BLM47_00465 [Candidatus Reconcilbacillus cellulovorans]|uniref:Glycosyltransferase 2-like domain-containing protein n=1 Tax=Candidatus Reconcilbacillus cellulovorans TaxID=1906605 RepID=A0A2A6E3R7_9BACL|nr:MAG: hypothetical protein BLM47_00465 [Candidatus Reconcilbacillus cellulovorans]